MGWTLLAGRVVTYLHESLVGGSFPDDIDDVGSVRGTRRWLVLSRRPTVPEDRLRASRLAKRDELRLGRNRRRRACGAC